MRLGLSNRIQIVGEMLSTIAQYETLVIKEFLDVSKFPTFRSHPFIDE